MHCLYHCKLNKTNGIVHEVGHKYLLFRLFSANLAVKKISDMQLERKVKHIIYLLL